LVSCFELHVLHWKNWNLFISWIVSSIFSEIAFPLVSGTAVRWTMTMVKKVFHNMDEYRISGLMAIIPKLVNMIPTTPRHVKTMKG